MKLNVFVPKAGADTHIAEKSAIVASQDQRDANRVSVYFEGNLYGASNLEEFHERLVSASGRLVTRYPTSAIAAIPADQMILAATFDTEINAIDEVFEPQALTRWANEPLEKICGVRIEPGMVYTMGKAPQEVGKALDKLQPISGGDTHSRLFRTRCGQTVEFRLVDGTFEFFDSNPAPQLDAPSL